MMCVCEISLLSDCEILATLSKIKIKKVIGSETIWKWEHLSNGIET